MWVSAEISLPPGLLVGCTVITGGVSRGVYAHSNMALHVGDEASAVNENRRMLQQLLGYRQVKWLDQVHGHHCIEASFADAGVVSEADASWTEQTGLALAVLTADCVPILLWSEQSAAIAAVHAGWRGLQQEILQHTIAAIDESPSQLCAWIGPCISAPHYEVGEDVWGHFKTAYPACLHPHPEQDSKRLLDLPAIAQAQLNRAGVTRVYQSSWCSFTDPRFYSYRLSGVGGAETGRMASIIARLN
jgi:purine-nucleoside/S-methyl-5'-thioadenosine phosphorylase / adenosine deaminase